MVYNPLILFRNWLHKIDPKHSDIISSEILCGLYLWQDRGSLFRLKYDINDEHLLEAGIMTDLLNEFINDVLILDDDLYSKHAAITLYSVCSLQLLNYAEEITGETLQEFHIGFLVNDQRELADFVESKMSHSLNLGSVTSRKLVKESWDQFSSKQFNFNTLHKYFTSKPSERE